MGPSSCPTGAVTGAYGLPARIRAKLIGMKTASVLLLSLLAGASLARAEEVKVPIDSDDKRIIYVAPDVAPTGSTVVTNGATVCFQGPYGSTTYGGINTAGDRPTYSVGASTGGDTSFSAGVSSEGRK